MNQSIDQMYDKAMQAIDIENSKDPNMDELDGNPVPKELLYSRRMTQWIEKISPSPSIELLLAARAQHICRWTTPRSEYPEGRSGYLKWRNDLKKFHAQKLGDIMAAAGFGQDQIHKAKDLLMKKNFSKDKEGQVLEDAACLVFLEYEFNKFSAKTEEDKMVDIVKKTWVKMSPLAQQMAQSLSMSDEQKSIVGKALA